MIAIYARQSIDKKDSISIEGQIEKCKYEAEGQDCIIFEDRGYSGKNIDRPNFTKMMEDVNNQNISKIIVYKIDRISRAIVDFGKIMEELDRNNVEFVSYTEKFDTSTPIGRAMLNIIMVFAQLERETIQQRVKDNYYQRGEQGYYLGGRAPFGYNKIETRLNGKKTYTFEENIEQAKIIRELFNEYSSTDASLGKLVAELNNKNIMTYFNNPWNSVSLGRTLRNPIYVKADADVYMYLQSRGAMLNNDPSDFIGENGCTIYAERQSVTTSKFTDLSKSFATLGLHKGIISSSTWLQCQLKLDKNKQVGNSGKGTHSWLSGLMKCGYCGLAIVVANNGKYNYINCGGRKQKFCYDRKKVIHLKDIEDSVQYQLFDYWKSLIDKDFMEVKEQDNISVNLLKIQLVDIENRINKLIGNLELANELTMEYININIKKLDDEKKGIQKQILNSSHKEVQKYSKEELLDIIKNWESYSIEKKKIIATSHIEKVIITDEKIQIKFKQI